MKLSEFRGQEHITSVLRAMVIKDEARNVAFLGDLELSNKIYSAFLQSLNCEMPEQGDACGKCTMCVKKLCVKGVWASFGSVPNGYLAFETRTPLGQEINKEILIHLILSWQDSKDAALRKAKEIATETTPINFVQDYLEIFKTILYLKQGMTVTEVDKLEPLSQLATRIPVSTITACMRLLWDAQNKTALPAALAVEITAALISETVKPSPEPARTLIATDLNDSKPINMIDGTIEQPLDVERMLALANE